AAWICSSSALPALSLRVTLAGRNTPALICIKCNEWPELDARMRFVSAGILRGGADAVSDQYRSPATCPVALARTCAGHLPGGLQPWLRRSCRRVPARGSRASDRMGGRQTFVCQGREQLDRPSPVISLRAIPGIFAG